ncbi:MAG: adenylate cyclase [Betaproteobacteria bacterium]|nr:adenylate cyclase [Betaproteobacteria bacterium]
MKLPAQRDALRVIQDIVAREKGSPLEQQGVTQVEAVLAALAGGLRAPSATAYSAREATIVFADLRGFSAIAVAYPTDVVLGLLNRCFGLMVDIVVRHYGTIDKFMGDAIMAIFHGDPAMPREHARRALLCAVEMQIAMHELRRRHEGERVPPIHLGIGISTGSVMAGLIGSDAYRAYTVIGEEVNLASRIEAVSLRGQVLMSEATYEHVRDFVHAGEPIEIHVKGRREGVRVREALGIPGLGRTLPRQDQRKSPRAEVTLDLDFWRLDGKILRPRSLRGAIRDISYDGLLVRVDEPLPLYSELKLAFDLPCVGFRASEIYARVVSMRTQGESHLAGVEFTSLAAHAAEKVRLFVQMRLQGECDGRGQVTERSRDTQ